MPASQADRAKTEDEAQTKPSAGSAARKTVPATDGHNAVERHHTADVRDQRTSAADRDGGAIAATGASAPARPITRRTVWSGWLLLLLGTPLALLACSGLSRVFDWSTPLLIGVDAVTALVFVILSVLMFVRSGS